MVHWGGDLDHDVAGRLFRPRRPNHLFGGVQQWGLLHHVQFVLFRLHVQFNRRSDDVGNITVLLRGRFCTVVGGSVVLQRDSASGGNAGPFHVPAFVLARGGRSWYIYERAVLHLDPWKAFEKVKTKQAFFCCC